MRKFVSAWVCVVLLSASLSPTAANLDALSATGEKRVVEGQAAQATIDRIDDTTADLEAEYKQITKVADGLQIYNALLQKQVDNQHAEMTQLAASIEQVALIERQIVPLMTRMLDSLEAFIELDVPFLPDERTARSQRLRKMMERSDVSAAEKFRRVLEAYEIENEYGRTIEAYRGSLHVDGNNREVDYLRIGRVALLYQSVGGEITGSWDRQAGQWAPLARDKFQQAVTKGLKVARKQVPPDLLVLPIPIASVAQP